MTESIFTFVIAFVLSFVGTIPPGTLSLTIVHLGLSGNVGAAWRMAIAAAMIEYPYAWIAVEFHDFLARSVEITRSFHLIAAVVMIVLGLLNLWSAARPSKFTRRFHASGFRKGVVLSLLNPLAIPFWMAMTAYLKGYGWIDLSTSAEVHAYLAGVSMGTLVLLMILAYLAHKVVAQLKNDTILQKVPGVVLILLGLYSVGAYTFG